MLARGMLRGRPMFFSNRYFRHAIGKIRRTDDMAALNSNEFLATVVQRTELGKLGQLFGKWYVESAHAKPDSEGWLWSGAPAAFGGSALGQQTQALYRRVTPSRSTSSWRPRHLLDSRSIAMIHGRAYSWST